MSGPVGAGRCRRGHMFRCGHHAPAAVRAPHAALGLIVACFAPWAAICIAPQGALLLCETTTNCDGLKHSLISVPHVRRDITSLGRRRRHHDTTICQRCSYDVCRDSIRTAVGETRERHCPIIHGNAMHDLVAMHDAHTVPVATTEH